MPTKFKASERTAFLVSAKSMCNQAVMSNPLISWQTFLLAYLTPAQLAMAEEVRKFTDRRGPSYVDYPVSAMQPAVIESPIKRSLITEKRLTVEFEANVSGPILPARHLQRLDNEHSAILREAERFVIERAFAVGNLKLTLEWLISNCTSIEAMRYLFPPTLWFLHKSGLGHIANQIEEVKKAPSLPNLRPDVRWRLKSVNNWWAIRVLMDDIEGGIRAPDLSGLDAQKVVKASVKFDSGVELREGKLFPKNGQEPGSEWLFFKKWD